jgi:hypothetical protein
MIDRMYLTPVPNFCRMSSVAVVVAKLTFQLYTGSLLSGAFSGLISAGIQAGMDGTRGLASWRWVLHYLPLTSSADSQMAIHLRWRHHHRCCLCRCPHPPRLPSYVSEVRVQ